MDTRQELEFNHGSSQLTSAKRMQIMLYQSTNRNHWLRMGEECSSQFPESGGTNF